MRVSLLLALFLGASAWAGPEQIIKQRAKEVRDQSNVRQGVAPPTQTTPTAANPTAPAAPAISTSLTQFQTLLGTIKPESPATAQQKQLLAAQLLAAAHTGAKPAAATANRLVEGLCGAQAEKALPATSRARLVGELDAVLNPGKYPQAQLTAIFADVQAIFQNNGLTRAKAVAISESVKALSGEVQK
jgi:hypothetical protein